MNNKSLQSKLFGTFSLLYDRLGSHAVCCKIDSSYQKIFISNAVKKLHHRFHNQFRGGGMSAEINAAVGLLRNSATIAIGGNLAPIRLTSFRVSEILNITTDGQNHLVGHKPNRAPATPPFHVQLASPCQRCMETAKPDLSQRCLRAWFICLDIGNGAGFPAPGMVDQQPGVDTEHLV